MPTRQGLYGEPLHTMQHAADELHHRPDWKSLDVESLLQWKFWLQLLAAVTVMG